jgi:acetyl-CoA acetyltransferase
VALKTAGLKITAMDVMECNEAFAMRELIRQGGRCGMISSCCGGGLGVAALIENLRR